MPVIPAFIGQGYSNRSARGTAQGDEPESLYTVMGGNSAPAGSGNCCFDYGNAETWNTSGTTCTDGTMEAIYVPTMGNAYMSSKSFNILLFWGLFLTWKFLSRWAAARTPGSERISRTVFTVARSKG